MNPFKKKVKVDDVVRDLSVEPFTENEVLEMLSAFLPKDLTQNSQFKKDEALLFSKLREFDGLIDYLNETMARDMRRHFGSTNPYEQATIKGAFSRIAYFKGLLASKPKTANGQDKPLVSRYAR